MRWLKKKTAALLTSVTLSLTACAGTKHIKNSYYFGEPVNAINPAMTVVKKQRYTTPNIHLEGNIDERSLYPLAQDIINGIANKEKIPANISIRVDIKPTNFSPTTQTLHLMLDGSDIVRFLKEQGLAFEVDYTKHDLFKFLDPLVSFLAKEILEQSAHQLKKVKTVLKEPIQTA